MCHHRAYVQKQVIELREVGAQEALSDVLGVGYEPFDTKVHWFPRENCLEAEDLHILLDVPTEDMIGRGFVKGRFVLRTNYTPLYATVTIFIHYL
jgi:hypothetical protein